MQKVSFAHQPATGDLAGWGCGAPAHRPARPRVHLQPNRPLARAQQATTGTMGRHPNNSKRAEVLGQGRAQPLGLGLLARARFLLGILLPLGPNWARVRLWAHRAEI